ncbi:MAG: zonular occludens toxin domain-containing protein [Kiritimatiellae bacterium]|nr:zonular occludens toxin domain-containing protein [Kiritimatiellia bacterium]
MIEVYEGRLGGGKTYHAVRRMCEYIAAGGCVCSNIMLNMEPVKAFLRSRHDWEYQKGQFIYLEDEQINQFYKHTPPGIDGTPSLVVIDEAHIWLNARDWANVLREMLIFLSQSRKCFTDIIFISQSALNLDKQIMRLVQYIWRFRDLKKLKISALGIGWPLNQFLMVQYDYDGKTILDKRFEFKDVGIYALYNTYTLLRTFTRLKGHGAKFDGKIKRKGRRIMRLIFFILLIIGLGWLAWSRLGSRFGFIKDKPVPSVVMPSAGPARPVAGSAVAPGAYYVKPPVDVVLHEAFLGVVEDERGRVVTTENDRYVQGQYCRLGKVLFCYDDKVLISGFDKKPHMVLADMAAMQRIRDRIAEDQAAKERATLAQSQNIEKPVLGSEEKVGLSQAVANKMLMP